MVSWQELRIHIEKHPRNTYSLPVFKIPTECRKPIQYPIEWVDPPASEASKPSEPSVRPLAPKSSLPVPSTHQVDPIVLGIAEGLYDNSSYPMKRQMECEEAQRIEGLLGSLYTSQGGRSRGWTKTGLESCLRPRCSSGGDLRALDAAKSTFPWALLRTDKTVSAFLDFLCVAKSIRVAVWFQEEKTVLVYPAADRMGGDPVSDYPLLHVSHNGFVLRSPRLRTGRQLLDVCREHEYSCLPPVSVSNSLSNLKVDELHSVATRLGMSECTGTKAERVEKISQYKLRQRLLSGES